MESPPDVAQVLAQLGPRAAPSHESAARLWGIELVEPGPDRVTVPRTRGRALVPGWVVRRVDLPPRDVVAVGGLRRTTPLRTVLDLARVLPQPEAVVAADSALRQRLVALPDLVPRCAAARGPGARHVRALPRWVDARRVAAGEPAAGPADR